MDITVKLEDFVKSLAEQALEQEDAAKKQSANKAGDNDADESSDEHEFDSEQLDQMLKEEKSKKRQSRRARASSSMLIGGGGARSVNKRKPLVDDSVANKRPRNNDSGDTNSDEQQKADEKTRGGKRIRKMGQKSVVDEENEESVKTEKSPSNSDAVNNNVRSSDFNQQFEAEDVKDRELPTKYEHIDASIVEHKRSQRDKIVRELEKVGCECYLPPDDIAAGRVACCDDTCTNRAVFIECPPKCRLGSACCNQRMQRREYLPLEVRYAGKKGYGLFALDAAVTGDLLIEYVGEIVTQRRFTKRARQYEKNGIRHHYFMSLDNNHVIDATIRGNEGRFINHSCDPNAEAQKWIVNGENRIGFFARRSVAANEELTIDYQFQRFGNQKPQRCMCGARTCRGFLGSESTNTGNSRGGKTQFELDLSKLVEAGSIRTAANAQKYAPVFIHATTDEDILTLVRVLQNSERHLEGLKSFLRLHGLNILHCYMTQLKFSKKPLPLMNEIMAVLQALVDSNAISSRNGLEDSGIMHELDEWAGLRPPQMPAPPTSTTTDTTKTHQSSPGKSVSSQKSDADSNRSETATQAIIESTLEELKRDEAQQERARFEKVFASVVIKVTALDLSTTITALENGLIECCKAPTPEARRQSATQLIQLKFPRLQCEPHTKIRDALAEVAAEEISNLLVTKKQSAAAIAESELNSRRNSNSSQQLLLLDQINYSSSEEDDDDDDDDENGDAEDIGGAAVTATLLEGDVKTENSVPVEAGLVTTPRKDVNKFRSDNNNSTTPGSTSARVNKQTPYMRLLNFLNELQRQARVEAEAERQKLAKKERKAAAAVAAAAAAAALAAVLVKSEDGGVVEVKQEDGTKMDIVDADDDEKGEETEDANGKESTTPQQPRAFALLEQADEQFRHDIDEMTRLRQYTLEFIDYCKQNLHIVFKIQKRSAATMNATSVTNAAGHKSAAASKTLPSKIQPQHDLQRGAEPKPLPVAAEKAASQPTTNKFSPQQQQQQQAQQSLINTNNMSFMPTTMTAALPPPIQQPMLPVAPPPLTPYQLYEQHKRLLADFLPVFYADEERRRNERGVVSGGSCGNFSQRDVPAATTPGENLSVAQRTAQLFEKQVEKQDKYDAWMLAVKSSAAASAAAPAAAVQKMNGNSSNSSKEAQYYAQHRNQVLQTVMHYMNGTRRPPDKSRVKQEIRQQRQRILSQPNLFMIIPPPPPPHQQEHHRNAFMPKSNQELKSSIYARIQSDICACVAERVSQQFGKVLRDAKFDELQKRLHVLLPTGERILLSNNKYTFENQRKYRARMPIKVGSNDWKFRLLQLKRFPLVKDFFARAAESVNSNNKMESVADDDTAAVPPLCNPVTAGYTSNFDHVFYYNKGFYDLPSKPNNNAAEEESASDDADKIKRGGGGDDADADDSLKLPLSHGINAAFTQQGPKGLLYFWDEETLQSSWLMPKGQVDETVDDFQRGAVSVLNAPQQAPAAVEQLQNGGRTLMRSASSLSTSAGAATANNVAATKIPRDATFTRFVWKNDEILQAALPQNYDTHWQELLNETQNIDVNELLINTTAAVPQFAAGGEASGNSKSSSSLAEWQAAAASTLLRRNRSYHHANNINQSTSPTAGVDENSRNSGGGGDGNRSRRASGNNNTSQQQQPPPDSSSNSNSSVMLTKSEFRDRVSRLMINALNPFRKSSCQKGRIQNKDDFKLLARELTHKIVDAEIQRYNSKVATAIITNEMRCFFYSPKLELKIEQYVNKYMQRFGKLYDPAVNAARMSSKSGGGGVMRKSTTNRQRDRRHRHQAPQADDAIGDEADVIEEEQEPAGHDFNDNVNNFETSPNVAAADNDDDDDLIVDEENASNNNVIVNGASAEETLASLSQQFSDIAAASTNSAAVAAAETGSVDET